MADERSPCQLFEARRARHIDRRPWRPTRSCSPGESRPRQHKVAHCEKTLNELPHANAKLRWHPVLTERRVRKILHIGDGVLTGAGRDEILAAEEGNALNEDLGVRVLLTRDPAASDVVALEQGPHHARTQRIARVVRDCHAECC